MRLKLLTLALALAAVSLPSHGEDLLDAYREARANDPVLAQADANRLSVGEGVPQARAAAGRDARNPRGSCRAHRNPPGSSGGRAGEPRG